MKPKDIVICIKTIKHNKLNKQYKILSIHKNEITVSVEENPTVISRSFYKKEKIKEFLKFDEYFMTLKKLRKTKLQLLKTISTQSELCSDKN